jgi:F0F1-type ATP synthase gamma subunit
LFPLSKTAFEKFLDSLNIALPKSTSHKHSSTYMKLEPSKKTIVRKAYQIMMNVIVYGAVLHNKTGEFASRMLAMK